MRSRRALLLAIGLFCSAASPAWSERAEQPAAARPRYGAGLGLASGTVFFLATEAGTVAVGAAHSFERERLTTSGIVRFERAHTRQRAADATRVLVGPGLPFSAEGGSLRTDLVVFALDAPPNGIRVLAAGEARKRMSVAVLGIPASISSDETRAPGRVRKVDDASLEVDLDEFTDVRGWGGAPIVSEEDGRVVGVVQAVQPDGRTMRILATPIAAVLDALRRPLEDGRGRSLTSLRDPGAPAPPPSPESKPPAAPAPKPEPGADAAARGDLAHVELRQSGPSRPVELALDHPADEAIFGEPSAFLSGRALVPAGPGLTTDVVFLLDVSGSVRFASGVDVDGDGVVGADSTDAPEDFFRLGPRDPGDSVLAAEVAAVRHFANGLDARYTRVALVTFAGNGFPQLSPHAAPVMILEDDQALTELPLTTDYERLQSALDRVLVRARDGLTNLAAGVDQATRELLGLRGAYSETADPRSQKVVVLLTDGVPSLPFYDDPVRSSWAAREAGVRAARAGIRILSYGIGDGALAWPIALVELARVTDGTFTPVRNPSELGEIFLDADLAGIESVSVRNTTLDAPAHAVEVGPDGSFGAQTPLAVGRNVIEVTARARDGQSAARRITLHHAPDAKSPAVPSPLLARSNRLLELQLSGTRRLRIQAEQAEVERLRQQLRIEVERERAKAEDRAARQRKELEIEVERAAPEGSAAE
jgi:hypothetical protein